ncbi:cytochrome P450 71D9-like [Pyrus ussuriensis x Pyrus communis]|uniref:Cytochrome P450 71D9-like n=1 Tax=Pyrus ussuriensis x Pyrus communis TaxID=2448454 RepID=A0A5N5GJL0_9ROSA|nr:cytochrome P450 71D9-like [Pyrus ussuriensis x Pyrus communis]
MEHQWPSFPIMFAFLLFIIMVLKIGKRGNTNNYPSNLPLGPWKLPFIGNLHQLIGCLPHYGLRDLAEKYGPLLHLRLGEVSTIIVSSAEFAKEVMKTHDVIFASRPQILATRILSYGSTNITFAPYGDYWRQLRKICTLELLSTERVQSYQLVREEDITSRAAFGKKTRDHEKFIYVAEEAGKVAGGFALADLYPSVSLLHLVSGIRPKLERGHKQADRIMENIINEHQKDLETTKNVEGESVEDLVHVLLKFHEHGGALEFSLTTNNIKAVIFDVFSAGSETSATTVDWAISEMMKNPRVRKKAQREVREVFNRKGKADETSIREMKYLNAVIKETLRLHPSVPLLLPREWGEKCDIGGYGIPVKSKVIVNAWAIGRDPKYWTEPERFKPERFLDSSIDYKGTNFEYIPFGAGRRICPGILYGLANVELPLALLLYHFDWKLPDGTKHEDLDMTETFGIAVRRKQDLHLIPIPYHPPPN